MGFSMRVLHLLSVVVVMAFTEQVASSPLSDGRRNMAAVKDSMVGYKGVQVRNDKSFFSLGKTDDIKLYRKANGNLKIVAPAVEFSTANVMVNGKPLGTGGGSKDLEARVAKLEKGGGGPATVFKTPCLPVFGLESVKAWNTKTKHHDVDLTKAFQQFPLDASALVDDDAKTGFQIDANIFWYIGVKFSDKCASASFTYALTGNLHHLRTAYSMDGKSWKCASNYIDYQGNTRKFTGCKGGNAPKYHGKTGVITFTSAAKYYAFGFRDAGMVSSLNMKCGNAIVTPAEHKFRNGNKCTDCPKGFSCDGLTACTSSQVPVKGKCQDCPAGYTCDGINKFECTPTVGIVSVMAWNTGAKSHDVDLTKSFSQFKTNAMILRDGKSETSFNIVSNIFWYIGVKIDRPCANAVFTYKLTSNLHHLRTAVSMDGNSWDCTSDYTDLNNKNRMFSGCKGGSAASYHGKHQKIRFTSKGQYYAFGFRDAGKVSEINMVCDGQIVGTSATRHVEDNVCTACPDGYLCDGKTKTSCGTKYSDDGKCKDCPDKFTCNDGVRTSCDRTFGIESVMAWNTLQKAHDVLLDRSFSEFNTDASVLTDKDAATGYTIGSNIFWYIGVKLGAPCRNAVFTYTLTGNLHHLRTAYSMDGVQWTCASDYKDYQNNQRTFTGCKGGSAASYHGKAGDIRFSEVAMYYAFGFRDAGKVTAITMTCEGDSVPYTTKERYIDTNVCKTCADGYSCADGKQTLLRIDSCMAWNTGQKNHDVDLSKSYKQFTTSGAVFIDGNGATGTSIGSNVFWYIGVKLTAECSRASFSFTLTGNLHHLRTAYSQDGVAWNCASDYKDYQNNQRTFNGCKGGKAAAYHGRAGAITFSKSAIYYAFGFRDAGKVSALTMKCNGNIVPKK